MKDNLHNYLSDFLKINLFKDIINPYNALSKNDNLSIKTTND